MNIKNIIKESIKIYLFESLKTQKEKYGSELVNKLKDLDPSNTYKYIDQICKFYKNGINKNEIKKYIDLYNKKLNRNLIPIKYRDINKIKDFNELKDIVDNKSKEKSKRSIKSFNFNDPDVKKQFYKEIKNNKGDWMIYTPYNTIQSIKLGKNSKWCISYTTANNWFNRYFINNRIIFYIFINQNKQKEKYQIQVYSNNRKDIYNIQDKKISSIQFEEQTGINPNDFKWYDQFKKYSTLIVYDKDGNVIDKIINGKKEGKWIEYYDNGNIETIEYYKNDKLDGEYRKYYPNGQIQRIEHFKNNSLNGKVISYYENGNKKREYTYKNNLLDGKFIKYYEDGTISSIQNYKNNKLNGKSIVYYSNGNINEITYYKDGKRNGGYIEYYSNGIIAVKSYYKDDNLDGKFMEYYENGNIEIEQNYKNGKFDGWYIRYDRNGNIVRKEYYKNGEQIKKNI